MDRELPRWVLAPDFMSQVYGGVEDLAWVRSYPIVFAAVGIGI